MYMYVVMMFKTLIQVHLKCPSSGFISLIISLPPTPVTPGAKEEAMATKVEAIHQYVNHVHCMCVYIHQYVNHVYCMCVYTSMLTMCIVCVYIYTSMLTMYIVCVYIHQYVNHVYCMCVYIHLYVNSLKFISA